MTASHPRTLRPGLNAVEKKDSEIFADSIGPTNHNWRHIRFGQYLFNKNMPFIQGFCFFVGARKSESENLVSVAALLSVKFLQ